MMHKDDLMKADLLSGILILGSGLVMIGAVVMTMVLALGQIIALR